MVMDWRTIGRLTELRLRRGSETLTAHCVGSALSDKQRSGQPKFKRCVMTDMTKKEPAPRPECCGKREAAQNQNFRG